MDVATKTTVTPGKARGIEACADERGIIRAAAMDQRGSLKKEIGKQGGPTTNEALTEFKALVTKVLTRHASAILMDPEYGLPAIAQRAPGTGVLLAYEKTGYDANTKGRLPDLLDQWSVRRLVEAGADAIKVLIYYDPFDDKEILERKHAWLERIGAECAALDVPFFLEPLAYDDDMDEKGLEFAKRKPEYVKAYMAKLSERRFGVDVLKVEVPVNMAYVQGSRANKSGEVAYSKAEALRHFKDASDAATLPFIYLSAGVDDDVFRESLEYAAEAGAKFNGVLCGRATWKDGIPVYAKQGAAAFESWLGDRGVKNIQMLNEVLRRSATPWWSVYGGKQAVGI
ncbi:MAG TPA: tagatose 1,6-diphosphate aldolase [Candidatus Limnocylindria bacterium]|nr:tagatose 1,6-diphosphate aldolase [Candidatus Limnocylindria bacterium]